ncbi:hypothetical protein LELG_02037 [Lodderomyces elongisporus NRRL YB-4239]|uniref:Zn(2)-C6 fungal-type domain-containing protein n=1 Tax=Lodderomyces elongisporus (strain ATCC 11503 / CBS 2605 / JCM 1781 / NBRC 1676 / NRRL YB-4239) TaxID=379508 RepID=A5DXF0_LODEL|nr:hypothetical protein LELG_02037 [Lodderomyces elongisporus NRRL YB-4239]
MEVSNTNSEDTQQNSINNNNSSSSNKNNDVHMIQPHLTSTISSQHQTQTKDNFDQNTQPTQPIQRTELEPQMGQFPLPTYPNTSLPRIDELNRNTPEPYPIQPLSLTSRDYKHDIQHHHQNNNNNSNNSNNSNSSHLTDHEAHLLNKPKRQRRSYSCGPCKLLKIKCDLQIPCASCKKFKRVARCMMQPPQPPSQEELNKIKERKKRSLSKKLKTTGAGEAGHLSDGGENAIASVLLSSDTNSTLDANQTKLKGTRSATLHGESSNPYGDHPISHITSQYEELDKNTFSKLARQKFKTLAKGDVLNQLLLQDSQKFVDLTMVDIKRIKRLLPKSFQVYERLSQLFTNTLHIISLDVQNFKEITLQSKIVYDKLLSILDGDVRNIGQTFKFNIVELRNLSLFFLILTNGYSFDYEKTSNFLLENRHIYNRVDLMEDWLNIAKFIKSKIMSFNSLTDIIYLMDWYLIIKNYYTFRDILIENYLEFNNLLNHVVLNNEFIAILEDTLEDDQSSSGNLDVIDKANESNNNEFISSEKRKISLQNKSHEFVILAKYWAQIRLTEYEFPFFQYKGSMLVSSRFRNTLVPHKEMLDILYGKDLELSASPLSRYYIKIWSFYFNKKSNRSTDTQGIIRKYLLFYTQVLNLSLQELGDIHKILLQQKMLGQTPRTIERNDLELLVMNQRLLLLFVQYLSFIRVESNYFPSLRYASFFTSMMNLFNHFTLLDDVSGGQLADILMIHMPLYYIRCFYQSLIYQSLFLVLMKYALLHNSRIGNVSYKVNYAQQYATLLQSFQIISSKFTKSHNIQYKYGDMPLYQKIVGILTDLTNILNAEPNGGDTQQPGLFEFNDFDDVLDNIESSMSPINWDCLCNTYHGSKDNLYRYAEKVWDLFMYLSNKVGEVSTEIYITPEIKFDDEFMKLSEGNFTGFIFNEDTVDQYMKLIVEPNVKD